MPASIVGGCTPAECGLRQTQGAGRRPNQDRLEGSTSACRHRPADHPARAAPHLGQLGLRRAPRPLGSALPGMLVERDAGRAICPCGAGRNGREHPGMARFGAAFGTVHRFREKSASNVSWLDGGNLFPPKAEVTRSNRVGSANFPRLSAGCLPFRRLQSDDSRRNRAGTPTSGWHTIGTVEGRHPPPPAQPGDRRAPEAIGIPRLERSSERSGAMAWMIQKPPPYQPS